MTRNYRGCPTELKKKEPQLFHGATCSKPLYRENVTRAGKSAVKCLKCGAKIPRWAVLEEKAAQAAKEDPK